MKWIKPRKQIRPKPGNLLRCINSMPIKNTATWKTHWLDEGEIVMFLNRESYQGFKSYIVLYDTQKYYISFGYHLISDCFEKVK